MLPDAVPAGPARVGCLPAGLPGRTAPSPPFASPDWTVSRDNGRSGVSGVYTKLTVVPARGLVRDLSQAASTGPVSVGN